MSERIPGERRGVWLIYHRAGRRNQAINHAKQDGSEAEPHLIGAARSDSPAETPYTVERLISRVTVDNQIDPGVILRIVTYWKERGLSVSVEQLP